MHFTCGDQAILSSLYYSSFRITVRRGIANPLIFIPYLCYMAQNFMHFVIDTLQLCIFNFYIVNDPILPIVKYYPVLRILAIKEDNENIDWVANVQVLGYCELLSSAQEIPSITLRLCGHMTLKFRY